MVDANASESVARHPAFLKMRATVVEKLETLHAELTEARASYDRAVAASNERGTGTIVKARGGQDDDDEVDLAPMLKAALDKLWKRPYECRIFTLQLLQALAQLDDQSLNSMRARLHCHACAPLSGCNTSPCFVCCVTPQ